MAPVPGQQGGGLGHRCESPLYLAPLRGTPSLRAGNSVPPFRRCPRARRPAVRRQAPSALPPDSGSAGSDIVSGLYAVASASLRGTAAAMLGVSIAAVSVCSFSPAPPPGCGRIGWPKHDNCGALGILPKTGLASCWACACAPIAARKPANTRINPGLSASQG